MKPNLKKAESTIETIMLTASTQEEQLRRKATGLPEGDKRDRLVTLADVMYHKGKAYGKSLEIVRKALYPDRYRDWRIRKREKSVTLNIYTKDPNRVRRAFSSAIRNTFDTILPYSFRVRHNGDIVFLFDPDNLPAEMTDKPKLVVKFKGDALWKNNMTWIILYRILKLIDTETWYGGEELKYNVVYYTT